MHRNVDPFADILDSGELNGGVLESSGLSNYSKVTKSVVPEGLQVTLSCQSCNGPREVIVEWPELIVIGTNGPGKSVILPRDWSRTPDGTAGITLPCKCGQPGISVEVMPDEARSYVQSGLSAGLVQLQLVQRLSQQAEATRGGGFRG